jgi:hypothetical protein
MRFYRWVVECIVAIRKFLDTRRNQLCASIIAIMMAVVGVQLRQTGYADARPGQYAAVEFEELQEPSEKVAPVRKKRTRATLRQAMSNSLRAIKSRLPSFSSEEQPEPKPMPAPKVPTVKEAPHFVDTPKIPDAPVVTVSQRRTQLTVPPVPKPAAPRRQRLILPEPTIIDLTDIEDPKPDIASLSGLIETDDDGDDDISIFDQD